MSAVVDLPSAPAQAAPKADFDFDPRLYQIASLSLLLLYGLVQLEFDITVFRIALTLASTLGAQWACTKLWKLDKFDPLSALISGLSLCLLLRTNYHAVAIVAGAACIFAKFAIRINGKHVFNPTNFACAAAMLSGVGWVSPGQWGNEAWLGFAFACAGMFVVNRSRRQDITVAALVFWIGGLFYRSWMVLEPWTIPVHRMQSGAFLLFSFFMISDPKTTPDSRVGRILFAALVCGSAWYWQFKMFHNNGLIWALFVWSLAVPLIDKLFGGDKYQWKGHNPAVPEQK